MNAGLLEAVRREAQGIVDLLEGAFHPVPPEMAGEVVRRCGVILAGLGAETSSVVVDREENERLRGLLREAREGFDRIIGMCDAPSRCTCGRPNGLPAVVACALSHSDAIAAEVDGEPTPTALEKQMREATLMAIRELNHIVYGMGRSGGLYEDALYTLKAADTAYRQRYGEEAHDGH